MIKLPVIDRNKWIIITNILWIVIAFVLVAFPVRKSSDYRKAEKVFTMQRDSLNKVVTARQQEIEGLATSVKGMEMKLDTANFINNILKGKISKYEKDYNSINTMSTDGNIELLSKFLSEEVSN